MQVPGLSSATGLTKLTDGQLSLNGLLTLLDSSTTLGVRSQFLAHFVPRPMSAHGNFPSLGNIPFINHSSYEVKFILAGD